MKSVFIFLLSQSILLPLIAGLIRLRRIGKSYQPFFIQLLVGFIAEIISILIIKETHKSNAIAMNIYTLVEWTLIAWQFHVWGFLQQRIKVFYGLLLFTYFVWIAENLVFGQIREFSPYFRFLYSFLIVLLSVSKINFMITHDNRNLFRNPCFLICIGFIIYFIYKIVYEWAYQVSIFGQSDITSTIIYLFAYINALVNIIFALAFLRIPARVKFTLK